MSGPREVWSEKWTCARCTRRVDAFPCDDIGCSEPFHVIDEADTVAHIADVLHEAAEGGRWVLLPDEGHVCPACQTDADRV